MDVEGIKERHGPAEQEIAELWLARRVKTDNFAIQNAAAAPQVTGQSFAQARKTFEPVSVARNQPYTIAAGIEQRTTASGAILRRNGYSFPPDLRRS